MFVCIFICMYICMYYILYMFVCFSGFSRDWQHLQNRKWYHMVGSWIIHCLGTFLAQWFSQVFPARARHVIVVPEDVFRIVGCVGSSRKSSNRFPVPWAPSPLRYPTTALRFYFVIQNTQQYLPTHQSDNNAVVFFFFKYWHCLDTDTFQSISRCCSHVSVCIMPCMQSLVVTVESPFILPPPPAQQAVVNRINATNHSCKEKERMKYVALAPSVP